MANLTNKIEEIIAITRLASFFEVYDSLGDALESFKKQGNSQTMVESV